MLGLPRRSRWLAVALLLATPGVAGTLLQAAHPCPVEAPWLPPAADAPGAHQHGDHGSEPGAPVECHCIGACHAASTWAPPSTGPVIALRETARVVLLHPVHRALAPAALPYRFLPPSTAPPVA
jgi:hypothetical protein